MKPSTAKATSSRVIPSISTPRDSVAVRQVTNLHDEVQIDRLRSLDEPVKLSAPTIKTLVATGQQEPPGRRRHRHAAGEHFPLETGLWRGSRAVGPRSFQDRYKAFENFSVIRLGTIKESESAWAAARQRRRRSLDRQASRASPPGTPCGRGQQRRREARDRLHERPPADAAAPHHQARLERRTRSRARRSTSPSVSTTSAIRRSAA